MRGDDEAVALDQARRRLAAFADTFQGDSASGLTAADLMLIGRHMDQTADVVFIRQIDFSNQAHLAALMAERDV